MFYTHTHAQQRKRDCMEFISSFIVIFFRWLNVSYQLNGKLNMRVCVKWVNDTHAKCWNQNRKKIPKNYWYWWWWCCGVVTILKLMNGLHHHTPRHMPFFYTFDTKISICQVYCDSAISHTHTHIHTKWANRSRKKYTYPPVHLAKQLSPFANSKST